MLHQVLKNMVSEEWSDSTKPSRRQIMKADNEVKYKDMS